MKEEITSAILIVLRTIVLVFYHPYIESVSSTL